jgi:hypothetical protein
MLENYPDLEAPFFSLPLEHRQAVLCPSTTWTNNSPGDLAGKLVNLLGRLETIFRFTFQMFPLFKFPVHATK